MSIRYKVILIGDSGVGKTSIINQFAKHEFNDIIFTTVAGSAATISVATPDGEVQLEVWDTAGQEQYKSIVGVYFRHCSAVILTFDVTNKQSFLNMKSWFSTVKETAQSKFSSFVVGNKIDLTDKRIVSVNEGRELQEQLGAKGYFDCSAKTGEGINLLFESIACSKLTNIEENDTLTVTSKGGFCC